VKENFMATKKKATAKKAAPKKAAPKKATAKKAAPKKATAKKAAPKKATAKKAAPKKATAKKAAPKKATVKKAAPKKAVAAPKKATAKKVAPKKVAPKKPRKPNPQFMAPLTPDAALGAVVGMNPLPRTEITKRLWDYIKKNNLQDAKNRRQINADDKLRAIFGRPSVTMFEMNKLIQSHIRKA
jgi:chromatin remodeling complex protein RSC6